MNNVPIHVLVNALTCEKLYNSKVMYWQGYAYSMESVRKELAKRRK